MKALITGVTGFVGSTVAHHATNLKWDVEGQCRTLPTVMPQYVLHCLSIDSHTDWSECVRNKNVVIHCAARVHQLGESDEVAQEAYFDVNTYATLNLAKQAAHAGVKRFIFISSIKVNGESTELGHPFTPDTETVPNDFYGASKYHAEQGLKQLAQDTGMEVVIIRPPLIYGPGVKANFASMIRWVDKGIPLPLGSINNQRSMVFIDNLVSLIVISARHSNAADRTFMVSDNHDISTTQLLKWIASSLGKRYCLLPIPQSLLVAALRIIGKQDIAEKLTANLQVDMSDTQRCLQWAPPFTLLEGIHATIDDYQRHKLLDEKRGEHL